MRFHKGAIRTAFSSLLKVRAEGFQFHKGAIRTNFKVRNDKENKSFQFHKGAIRTDDANVPAVRVPNFNSIKVRLELGLSLMLLRLLLYFNSIKVRLELSEIHHNQYL